MDNSDWKTVQINKDIKFIKSRLAVNEASNWALVIDVFLVLLAFVWSQIFEDHSSKCVNWAMIIIAITGAVVPVGLFVLDQIKKNKKKKISDKIMNTRELVDVFETNICDAVINAETFSKKLRGVEQIDSYQTALLFEFYIIETECYLKKAIRQLLKIDTNLNALIAEDDPTKDKIEKKRLVNVIKLWLTIYDGLVVVVDEMKDKLMLHGIKIDLKNLDDDNQLLVGMAKERGLL